jgi:hypothetical protein
MCVGFKSSSALNCKLNCARLSTQLSCIQIFTGPSVFGRFEAAGAKGCWLSAIEYKMSKQHERQRVLCSPAVAAAAAAAKELYV